ncbi:MAG: hypothetical protein ACTSRU_10025 [Candidatus Hodarchaeales archaeon]
MVNTNQNNGNDKKETDKDKVQQKEEEDSKFNLDESISKEVMDSIEALLKEKAIILLSRPEGSGLAFSPVIIKRKFPDLTSSDISDVIRFVGSYIHFIVTHDINLFYDIFETDEDKSKAQNIVKMIKSHRNFGILTYRILRYGNYPIGEVIVQKKTIEIPDSSVNRAEYFDIFIPCRDSDRKSSFIRLELDKFEIESIVSSLVKILEKEKEEE